MKKFLLLILPALVLSGCGQPDYQAPTISPGASSNIPPLAQAEPDQKQDASGNDTECGEPGAGRYIVVPASQGGGAYCECNNGYEWDTKTFECLPNKQDSKVTECTGFEYSRWSHCAEDGTQNRVITKTLPTDNCYGGNPVQEQKCVYTLKDYGTAPEMLNRMLDQISKSDEKKINMEFRSGEEGENITALTWLIDNLGRYQIHSSTKVADTQKVIDVMDIFDVNKDFKPDYFTLNNGTLQKLDQTQPGHDKILALWGVYNTFFGVYILAE